MEKEGRKRRRQHNEVEGMWRGDITCDMPMKPMRFRARSHVFNMQMSSSSSTFYRGLIPTLRFSLDAVSNKYHHQDQHDNTCQTSKASKQNVTTLCSQTIVRITSNVPVQWSVKTVSN
ncbi:hypothetical protein EYF80_002929 [Liparis tanakae]|uniref:Uncharacterized protein n=1 Tax=Liparis tanakae TaxID=230148 RepID=A0A4Z2J951_9TELE|nr:hypothetical protein EYF80_002929 [Liparis tanakae]